MRIDDREVPVDETWLAEWMSFGFAELERYLRLQAAFAQWLVAHGETA